MSPAFESRGFPVKEPESVDANDLLCFVPRDQIPSVIAVRALFTVAPGGAAGHDEKRTRRLAPRKPRKAVRRQPLDLTQNGPPCSSSICQIAKDTDELEIFFCEQRYRMHLPRAKMKTVGRRKVS